MERRRVPFKTNPGHIPICNAKKYQFFKTLDANRISNNFLSRTCTTISTLLSSQIPNPFFPFSYINPCLKFPLKTWIHVTFEMSELAFRIANAQTGRYFRLFDALFNIPRTRNDAVSSNIPRQDGLINPS